MRITQNKKITGDEIVQGFITKIKEVKNTKISPKEAKSIILETLGLGIMTDISKNKNSYNSKLIRYLLTPSGLKTSISILHNREKLYKNKKG